MEQTPLNAQRVYLQQMLVMIESIRNYVVKKKILEYSKIFWGTPWQESIIAAYTQMNYKLSIVLDK